MAQAQDSMATSKHSTEEHKSYSTNAALTRAGPPQFLDAAARHVAPDIAVDGPKQKISTPLPRCDWCPGIEIFTILCSNISTLWLTAPHLLGFDAQQLHSLLTGDTLQSDSDDARTRQ